jgi:hypothetical protein
MNVGRKALPFAVGCISHQERLARLLSVNRRRATQALSCPQSFVQRRTRDDLAKANRSPTNGLPSKANLAHSESGHQCASAFPTRRAPPFSRGEGDFRIWGWCGRAQLPTRYPLSPPTGLPRLDDELAGGGGGRRVAARVRGGGGAAGGGGVLTLCGALPAPAP